MSKTNNPWAYSDVVRDHFFHPRNLLNDDEDLSLYNGVGEVGSPACGDVMKIWIQVCEGKIVKSRWKTFGCASAIASTSILSEMITENGGMPIENALKIKPLDIINRLGTLPRQKIHCSVLGDRALRAAIENYMQQMRTTG